MPIVACFRRAVAHALLAAFAITTVGAQARDTVIVVSITPKGAPRFGVPTEYTFVADVTLTSADSGALAVGFNIDDPARFVMRATAPVHRGTQRVELRTTVAPLDWSERGARFSYILNIRPLELPSADGRTRGLATVKGEFLPTGPTFGASGTSNAGAPTAATTGGNDERTYFEFQVEKPVRQAPGSAAPRYPVELKAAGVEGQVLAQFVVDTIGAPVLTSFKVLKTSDAAFAEAVRTALPNMHFTPAEVRGRKVRQLVQQPFVFAIASGDKTVPAPENAQTARPPLSNFTMPDSYTAPAPTPGYVSGWRVTYRMSIDSGRGAPPQVITTEMVGTTGRLRMAMTSAALAQFGTLITIIDSTANRVTMLMTDQRRATIVPRRTQLASAMRSQSTQRNVTIKDLGSGDRIVGQPTRHYAITGSSETRLSLDSRSCTYTSPMTSEYWVTSDSALMPVLGQMRRGLRTLEAPPLQPGVSAPFAGDTAAIAKLGIPLKTVMRTFSGDDANATTITLTYEITDFSTGTVLAALFEPPEGYQVMDMAKMALPVNTDSIARMTAERLFDTMKKSMPAVRGSTMTCTP